MKVFVNGEDCSNMALLDSLSLSDDVGKRSSGDITFRKRNGFNIKSGHRVDIFNAEGQHIFGGFAKRPVIRPRGAGDPEIKVKLVDNTDIAERRIVAETYVEEIDHSIVKDVYDRYLKEEGVKLGVISGSNSVITTETKTETTQAQFNSGVLSGVQVDAGGTLTLEDISDNPPISRIVEDFEDEEYNFDFSGDWYRTTLTAYQGTNAFRSAGIDHREDSDLTFSLEVREGAIGKFSLFYWVSSEENEDFFKIYINGVNVFRASGVDEVWRYFTIDLMPGEYDFIISYEKDRSVSRGRDRVLIDQMVFEEWEGNIYPSQGERIAPKITSTADVIKTIRIDYDAELLSGTKVEFYYSIDGQETWELAENDVVRRSVNGAEGMYIKAVLSTTDTNKTPSIYEIRYIIETTSGTFVQKAVFNYIKASQALDELCELSGSVWWITADKVLHYVSMDEFKAPWGIDERAKIKNVGIETDLNEYRNRQYLRAGQDITDLQIERIKGDGEKRTFNLGYKVAQRPVIKLNGVEQTPGIRQVDKNRPFYWSKGEKEITQDESRTPLTATDVLTVEYYGFYPIVVIADDDDAIAEMASRTGDTGIYEAVDENETIDSSDLALEFANSKLRKYAKINTRITFDTELKGLQAGQLIPVNLPDYEISGDFLIKSVKITARNDNYVTHSVELIDGEDVGGWEQFFKQLARASKTYVIRENEVLIRLAKQAEEIGFSEEMSYQTYACHFPSASLLPVAGGSRFPC